MRLKIDIPQNFGECYKSYVLGGNIPGYRGEAIGGRQMVTQVKEKVNANPEPARNHPLSDWDFVQKEDIRWVIDRMDLWQGFKGTSIGEVLLQDFTLWYFKQDVQLRLLEFKNVIASFCCGWRRGRSYAICQCDKERFRSEQGRKAAQARWSKARTLKN